MYDSDKLKELISRSIKRKNASCKVGIPNKKSKTMRLDPEIYDIMTEYAKDNGFKAIAQFIEVAALEFILDRSEDV